MEINHSFKIEINKNGIPYVKTPTGAEIQLKIKGGQVEISGNKPALLYLSECFASMALMTKNDDLKDYHIHVDGLGNLKINGELIISELS